MPWFNFTDEELKLATWALDVLRDESGNTEAEALRDRIKEVTAPYEFDEEFRTAARLIARSHGLSDPHDVGNEGDMVSWSDEGAYVMAWIWVDNSEAGIPVPYLIELVEGGEVVHAELFKARFDDEASIRASEYWNETPAAALDGEGRYEVRVYFDNDDEWEHFDSIGATE